MKYFFNHSFYFLIQPNLLKYIFKVFGWSKKLFYGVLSIELLLSVSRIHSGKSTYSTGNRLRGLLPYVSL